jgi:mono/diheme cytochrome c family protein
MSDRLAPPPTVTNPTQADQGAQLFWLHCQPCHGDRAQGLTDDWRAQYPPEDQNCWKSGCHGDRPYQAGFTLPHTVPALVGPGTLDHYATAAELFAFVSHAMPFQAPGSLKPEEYWAITAFILRGHGLSDAALPLTSVAAAGQIPLGTPPAVPTTNATAAPPAPASNPAGLPAVALAAGAVVALAGAAGWWLWARRGGRTHG